jgi:DUF4097 and DUF4098 domain-containing protein YvlB
VVDKRPGSLTGAAQDEWSRTYTLTEGGEVQLNTQNGAIDVEAVEGNSVDVKVDRIAHASTNQAASEIVPRIAIKEEVTPAKIVVRTEGLAGIIIGVAIETRYHVRAPKSATIRVRGTDKVSVKGFSGRVVATGINATITADDLSGSVEARSVNGDTNVALTSLGGDLVDIRATNGSVHLKVPLDGNANLNATVTNGKIDVGDLKFEPIGDQTPRRVRGKLNAGGAPIDVTAVNGNVTVKSEP